MEVSKIIGAPSPYGGLVVGMCIAGVESDPTIHALSVLLLEEVLFSAALGGFLVGLSSNRLKTMVAVLSFY